MQAAEEEAQEILHAARSQAEAARNEALSTVGAIHSEADERLRDAERIRGEAVAEADRLRSRRGRSGPRAAARPQHATVSSCWPTAAPRPSRCCRQPRRNPSGRLTDGQTEAERALAEAHAQAAAGAGRGAARRRTGSPREAREQTERLLAAGGEDLSQLRSSAEEQAQEVRAKARADAREIVSEAHVVAREVLREGTELSRNLRELSVSLHNNAERLIRDVRLAHGGMTARLDQAGPGAPGARTTCACSAAGAARMTRETTSTCRSSFRRGETGGRRGPLRSRRSSSSSQIGTRTSQSRHRSRRHASLANGSSMDELTPSQKGAAAEAAITAAAIRLDLTVLRPLCEGGRYDLVIDHRARSCCASSASAPRGGERADRSLCTNQSHTPRGYVSTQLHG